MEHGHHNKSRIKKTAGSFLLKNTEGTFHCSSSYFVLSYIRAVAPTPTSQAMAGLVFTNCANLSE